jgi:hypothetical protein
MCGAARNSSARSCSAARSCPELVPRERLEIAVDQLAASRGGVACEVVLFAQHDAEATSGGIARDAGAVDAAADDQQIDRLARVHFPPAPAAAAW